VVDQFEELFRYRDENPVTEEARRRRDEMADEAAEFVQVLLAAHRSAAPIFTVLTMRSDYIGECAAFQDLAEALNDCQYLVPRLTREQKRQAVEGPLGKATIDPNLVQRMLNDVGHDPDQLPILQHALMRTWNKWKDSDPEHRRPIQIEDYEAIGGFENALNQHAIELMKNSAATTPAFFIKKAGKKASESQAMLASVIFKRLTARGRNSRERRDPTQLSELYLLCEADTDDEKKQVRTAIDVFRAREASFLMPLDEELIPETYIDIAHESLIRQWKQLRNEWMTEEAADVRLFRSLLERSSREALTGLSLVDAQQWNARRNQVPKWAQHYEAEGSLETVLVFIGNSESKARKAARKKIVRNWISVVAAVLFAMLALFSLYLLRDEQKSRADLDREFQRDKVYTAQRLDILTRQKELADTLLKTEQVAEAARQKSNELEYQREIEAARADTYQQKLESANKQIEALKKLQPGSNLASAVANIGSVTQTPTQPPTSMTSANSSSIEQGCQLLAAKDFRDRHAKPLTKADIQRASDALQVDLPTLWAFLWVETAGSGYLPDLRPRILFERNIFSRLTSHKWDSDNTDISNPTPGGYGASGSAQYDRLQKAAKLDCYSAIQSTSWGMGLLLGEQFAKTGFPDSNAYVAAQMESEGSQLDTIVHFLKSYSLDAQLRSHNWATLAHNYNGAAAATGYAAKLAQANTLFENPALQPNIDTRAAQFYLQQLGFYRGSIDGATGPATLSALHSFQSAISVDPTPVVDERSVEELAIAAATSPRASRPRNPSLQNIPQ